MDTISYTVSLFHICLPIPIKIILQPRTPQPAMIKTYTEVLCARCNRPPQTSLITNKVFVTYLCYQDCGNVFWTQLECPNPKCGMQNYTRLISKPKTGELIKCNKCQFQCFYFRCPNKECKKIMIKEASTYRMGWPTSCTYCQQEFKLVVCSCGGEIYMNTKETVYEGAVEYHCKQCDKSVVFTTCPECLKPTYHMEAIQIGQRIKCSNCKQLRNFVPCPACGKSIYNKDFYFGQENKCNYCLSEFEYKQCPNGCGINFYYTKGLDTPMRKCNRLCNTNFIMINCNKCKYPLYLDNYEFGFWREEQCPACKSQIKFHLCQCGLLTKNSNRCINPQCPVPTSCKNYSKEWKLQQQKNAQQKKNQSSSSQNADYNEKQCKLCYDLDSCMVNQACRHMMMCQGCYRTIRQRAGQVSQCPICKMPGRYHKFVEPILQ